MQKEEFNGLYWDLGWIDLKNYLFYETSVYFKLEYKPDSIYTNENLENVKEISGAKAVQNLDELKKGVENMLGTMKALIVIMVVVAAVLGMVIIYNLGVLSL